MKPYVRKSLSVLLSLLMVLSVLGGMAFAAEGDDHEHAYGEPTWSWAEGYGSATATFVCACGDEQPVTDAAPGTVEVSAADCTNDQVVKYTAKVTFNDEEYTTETENVTVEESALGHTIYKSGAIAPDCEHNGRIAYWYCAECGMLFSDENGENEITQDQTVDPKTGHNFQETSRTEPTCTGMGEVVYTCTVCHKSYSETSDQLDHVDADGDGYCDTCTRTMDKDACLLCGKTHTGTWGTIVRVIHHVIWTFQHLFD